MDNEIGLEFERDFEGGGRWESEEKRFETQWASDERRSKGAGWEFLCCDKLFAYD